MVVLLADEPSATAPREDEPFDLLTLDDLGCERGELHDLASRYEELQFSYSLTPVLIAHLLADGFDQVVFIKQESLVTGPLDPITSMLDLGHWLTLTPHMLGPAPGADGVERELNILQAGVYNGGIIGVRADPRSDQFLEWWWTRLRWHCRWDLEHGLHWEQRWLDLVPSLFGDVCVIRDPGCNIGHWNVTERNLELRAQTVWAQGQRASLLRFSGFDADSPLRLTRYNQRVQLEQAGTVGQLLKRYHRALIEEGFNQALDEHYAFSEGPAPGVVTDPKQDPQNSPRVRSVAVGQAGDWSEMSLAGGPKRPRPVRRRALRRLRCRLRRGSVVCTNFDSRFASRAFALRDSLHSWHPELPLILERLPEGPMPATSSRNKAALIARLLREGWSSVLYLDADTLVTGPLDRLLDPLKEDASVVLTPHLKQLAIGAVGSAQFEMLLCAVGTFNAGVVGVCNSAQGIEFADWWASRLIERCEVDIAAGVAYDQRWLDLAPALFDQVKVIREPGLNVGYWNFYDSQIGLRDGQVVLDGRRVSLLHFSGFEVDKPQVVSRYTPELSTSSLGAGGEAIFEHYQRLLRDR